MFAEGESVSDGTVYWGDGLGYGWDAPEKLVCMDCVGDDDYFWEAGAIYGPSTSLCAYCGKGHAGPVGSIVDVIGPALHRYFTGPGNAGAILDDGEWLIDTIGTEKALGELWRTCGSEELRRDVAGAFRNREWVPCNGHFLDMHEGEQFTHAWSHFAQITKHRTRYFLDRQEREFGENPWMEYPSPAEFLARLGEFVRDLGLIRTLDGQRALYRIRHEMDGTSFDTFGELGPPPDDLARAGRMNPAGIAYYYAAREPGTAMGEVVTEPPARIAIGEFRPNDGLAVLDLTDLPELPSVFDMDQYDRYQRLVFLGDFVERISMPVRKDGMEHVEYVPSQVVCEFFAQVFGRKDDGRHVDGIAYRSAVVPDGQNVVLFPPKGRRTWQDVAELVSTDHVALDNRSQIVRMMAAKLDLA